jgi:hypothetical protein
LLLGETRIISLRAEHERSHMYDRMGDPRNVGPSVQPPRRMLSDAEHIHRAVYARSGQIRTERPGSSTSEDLQDQEPRAVLRVFVNGRLEEVEFFESTFSADQQRFLEEYVQAARECGNVAVLYPGQSFPEDYVLRKVEAIFERVRTAGVTWDVSVHGFLYDFEGQPRAIL